MQNTISVPVGKSNLVVEPHNIIRSDDSDMTIVYGVLKDDQHTHLCDVAFSRLDGQSIVTFRSIENNYAVTITRNKAEDDLIVVLYGKDPEIVPFDSPDTEVVIKSTAHGLATNVFVPSTDESFRLVQGLVGVSAEVADVFFSEDLFC